MNHVLIDTAIWIDYFNNGERYQIIENLIDSNLVVINEIILSEILPPLIVQNNKKIVDLLYGIHINHLQVNWDEIVDYQVKNIKNGINKVGIPDLLLLQNIIQNDFAMFTVDKHFELMSKIYKIRVIK